MATTKKFLDQTGVTTLWGQVKAKIKEEADRAVAKEAELKTSVDEAKSTLDVLVGAEGTDAGKSVRIIANEELAKQLITEDASENLDTLAEVAAWIQSHPNDAAAMNSAIAALQSQMVGIEAGEGAVKSYVDSAIAALDLETTYATTSDLTTLAQSLPTTYETKGAADQALADAKTYVDESVISAEELAAILV